MNSYQYLKVFYKKQTKQNLFFSILAVQSYSFTCSTVSYHQHRLFVTFLAVGYKRLSRIEAKQTDHRCQISDHNGH